MFGRPSEPARRSVRCTEATGQAKNKTAAKAAVKKLFAVRKPQAPSLRTREARRETFREAVFR